MRDEGCERWYVGRWETEAVGTREGKPHYPLPIVARHSSGMGAGSLFVGGNLNLLIAACVNALNACLHCFNIINCNRFNYSGKRGAFIWHAVAETSAAVLKWMDNGADFMHLSHIHALMLLLQCLGCTQVSE